MKRIGTQWWAVALVAGLVLSLEASAQPVDTAAAPSTPGNFGSMGQIVIGSEFQGAIGYNSGSEAFFIGLRPSVDYFLKENLSVGGAVALGTTFREGDDPVELGVRLRAGYNVPLNEKVTVWPTLGVGLVHVDQLLASGTFFEIAITAPFLVHLAPHFFVGGGPGLITQLGDSTSVTLQVSTVVGGYF